MEIDKLKRDYSLYQGTNDLLYISFNVGCCPYKIQEGDILTLEVRDYRNENKIVIKKEIITSNFFTFKPEDTNGLSIGYYIYNVKFKEHTTGFVYEIISPSVFWIKGAE